MAAEGKNTVRFGAYVFDKSLGELRKNGVPLKLQPQPAIVLTALLSRPGELITREVLRAEVWGEQTVVDFDANLNYCVRQLRAVLLDDAERPQYIETVPRRGYRFIGTVTPALEPPPVHRKSWTLPTALAAALAVGAIIVGVWSGRNIATRAPRPESERLFRQARFLFDEFTPEGRQKSLAYFQDAITVDPSYGAAYGGLANAYLVETLSRSTPVPEYLEKAKAAALRSIALAPKLAAGHTALAHFFWQSWQWASAEAEFRKALALAPGDADAHQSFAELLGSTGRTVEALHEAQRAVDLDPVSATNLYTLAQEAFMARRYDEAVARSLRALELHPGLRSAHNIIARSYAQKGMYSEAIAAFQQWQPNVASSGSLPVAYVLALSGRKREAEATIAEWRGSSDQEGRKPLFLPMCYIALGESDRAMDYIDEAFSQHVTNLIWLKVDPEFDALRDDPKFHLVLRKMGLE